MRRRALALALACAVLAACAYAAQRLWLKSSDLLRPVVITRNADPGIAEPSIAERVRALSGIPRAGDLASLPMPPRLIALTFDDGPYPVTTPLLLQTLRDLRVPATFFLIGRDAEQFPELTRAIAAGGHEIGDHTLTHPDLDRLDEAAVAAELRGGADALERIAPDPAERRLFRPPHGRYTAATIRAAQSAGYDTILWNDDPGDWRAVGADDLRRHVESRMTIPEILLLHSGRIATVEALPAIVAAYRAAGFRFVTVGGLLRATPTEALNTAFKAADILPTPTFDPNFSPRP